MIKSKKKSVKTSEIFFYLTLLLSGLWLLEGVFIPKGFSIYWYINQFLLICILIVGILWFYLKNEEDKENGNKKNTNSK